MSCACDTSVKPKRSAVLTIDDLVSGLPEEIVELTFEACDLVRATLPQARERIIAGWRIVAFSKRTIFLYLAPSRTRLAIGFNQGVHLRDPEKLLVRFGNSRESRNLVLPPGSRLPVSALQRLLVQAFDLAR
jgi:hypothetical protein